MSEPRGESVYSNDANHYAQNYVTVWTPLGFKSVPENEAGNYPPQGFYTRTEERLTRFALDIQNMGQAFELYQAHVENLIQRVRDLEVKLGLDLENGTMVPCPRKCDEGRKVDEDTNLLVPCSECDGLGKVWIPPWNWSQHTGDLAGGWSIDADIEMYDPPWRDDDDD